MKKTFVLLAALSLTLVGCGRNMSPDVYSSSTSVGKVVYGTVVSARPITIKDTDRLGNNGTGVLAGGALGAAAGSGVGHGAGRTTATVGGAIVGAVAGAVVQDQLSTQDGMEYIVRLDKTPHEKSTSRKRVSIRAKGEVDSDVNQAAEMAQTQTDTISVIQDNSVIFSSGQHVMVIYRDDRARLEAVQ